MGSQATVTISGERAIAQTDSKPIKVNWNYRAVDGTHELGYWLPEVGQNRKSLGAVYGGLLRVPFIL